MKRIARVLSIAAVSTVLVYGAMLATAAGLSIAHTAFPNPDSSTNFGLFQAVENLNTAVQTNMLSKVVVNNNPASSVSIGNIANTLFVGTQPAATMAFALPSAANSLDNEQVMVYTQAAIASSVSWTSSGASVVGAPSTMAANTVARFIYDAGTTSWYRVD